MQNKFLELLEKKVSEYNNEQGEDETRHNIYNMLYDLLYEYQETHDNCYTCKNGNIEKLEIGLPLYYLNSKKGGNK
jgi:predicted hydrolase (HD superfamily)